MNVLVTGGAGYIGSQTSKALARAGHKPIAYDNLIRGHVSAVRWGPLIRADIGDAASLEAAMQEWRIAAVLHFAGFAYVGESMQEPGKYFTNNVTNTLTLLEAMRRCGVGQLIYSSSCATYGLPQSSPIAETHPQVPINPYGESKLMAERMIGWYSAVYGLRWVTLRYFNAAGADPEGEIGEHHVPETHLIPLAIESALAGEPLRVFGTDYPTADGTAIRDYTHVADLADAHVRALAYLERNGDSRAFNLGSGCGSSVYDVVRAVANTGGKTVPVREFPRRPGDPPELIADASVARRCLGWHPRFSRLETIVRDAWAWRVTEPAHEVAGAFEG